MKATYDWKITLKKGLISFAEIFLTGLLAMKFQEPMFLAMVPLIEMLLNWIKHRNK